jgi:hypothetical protein
VIDHLVRGASGQRRRLVVYWARDGLLTGLGLTPGTDAGPLPRRPSRLLAIAVRRTWRCDWPYRRTVSRTSPLRVVVQMMSAASCGSTGSVGVPIDESRKRRALASGEETRTIVAFSLDAGELLRPDARTPRPSFGYGAV